MLSEQQQNLTGKLETEAKSIHIYMTAHFPSLEEALQ